MKFVLVNERAPRRGDLSSRQPYCDHACFVGENTKITPMTFRLGTGIDSLPFLRSTS
jgi:hypothetical protein